MSENNSLHTLKSSQEREKDTIGFRIQFVQELLKDKELKPLVDFDCCETEHFKFGKHDNDSEFDPVEGDAVSMNDTRYLLHKRVYDFNNIINQLGGKLYYIKSGTTGHTFKGVIETKDSEPFTYAVKVVAYPKKSKYKKIYDSERPENAEIMMIRLLSYFIVNKQTPHIILPIATFNTSIKPFLTLLQEEVVDQTDKRYMEFLDNYKEGIFYDEVSILISEWANRGDLLDYIRKNYRKFQLIHWKVFFFQIISTLAVIQSKFPAFRHNDLKANNILVHKISRDKPKFTYRVLRKNYSVPNIGYSVKLWDFDFACIPGIVNNIKVSLEWTKPINVTPEKNCYYDLHYFFNTLAFTGFFPKFMSSEVIPQDVKAFVQRIIPLQYRTVHCVHKPDSDAKTPKPTCDCHKYVHERGRLLVTQEYTTPAATLNDPFFAEFIKTEDQPRKPSKKPTRS
ncbi:MAG: serine/threonine protein kinase [Harvfovirus sp.]|uniref:Serine/threonine protein kinase n=1 Tax=Harvfovirus sp. TaxID=2487768 RepID=A0A3G5A0R4_9VIRU|nr:MAG: serine/threonine protein kinase [Harvfovirus sp.]